MHLTELERALIGEIWTSRSLEATLNHLCDGCSGRFAGTDDERRAGDYMLERFREFGLQNVVAEPFSMAGWQRGVARLALLAGDAERELPCTALAGSPAGTVRGPLIDVGPGTPADYERLGDAIAGKMVLASAEGPHRLEKYARALAAGAVAFLFAGTRPGTLIPAGSVGIGRAGTDLPSIGVSLETAAYLRRRLAGDGSGAPSAPTEVRVHVEGQPQTVTARNIVAELPGSDPDAGWIVACGHYDGHDIAQGAQDNATGTAVVVEAARVLSALRPPLKAGLRFILFSGEEMGMYGSEAYVRQHAGELDRIRTVFNADIVGLAAPLKLVLQNSTALAAYLDRLPLADMGAQVAGSRLVPYSDHFSFTLAGISSLMAVTSSPGPGNGWAHTVADTLDKLDIRAVREAAVTTTRILLRMALEPESLPCGRQSAEEVKQALVDAGLQEPLRVRGAWPE